MGIFYGEAVADREIWVDPPIEDIGLTVHDGTQEQKKTTSTSIDLSSQTAQMKFFLHNKFKTLVLHTCGITVFFTI